MPTSIDELFDALKQQALDDKKPQVLDWHPERVGEIDIRIDEAGQWWHEGRQFERHSLVKLFSNILRREGDDYFLVTPVEKLRITVADVPFMAVDLNIKGEGVESEVLFTTNVGDHVLVDQQHPIEMRNGKPYLEVRDGLQARLTTNVYYQLADRVDVRTESGAEQYVVHSCGTAFSLGSA